MIRKTLDANSNELIIELMTKEEWADAKERKEIFCSCSFFYQPRECTLEKSENGIGIWMVVPRGKDEDVEFCYEIYLNDQYFILIGKEETLEPFLEQMLNAVDTKKKNTCALLEQWFLENLKDDFSYIQSLEQEVSKMEEMVLNGECSQFHYKMFPVKKNLARRNHYYGQLRILGQELINLNHNFLENKEDTGFTIFRERCDMLSQENQVLREYLMQVQEVYQAQIEIRQNDVMKTLTMVTTFFLPLTLIAGWYGMNFEYMPEIHAKWGYPVTIGVSIIVVILWLIISKKKKFW